MDGMFGLILLFAGGCLLAGPILALVALSRIRRLADLNRYLDELEERLSRVERRGAPAARRAAAPETGLPADVPEAGSAPSRGRETTAPPVVTPAAPADTTPPPSRAPAPVAGTPPPLPEPATGPVFTVRGASSRPPAPPAPPSRPAVPIDWERWVGIRGAAVLGAVALALAGLLFFKYSIEQGLITPAMRVVLGTFTGLGCLVGSEWLRSRGYRQTAEGISGAGVVILYAAFWAAHALYHLIGMTIGFGLMVLVTAACCLLAVRHASLLVAVLGLVGGFATPLLLASGADRPIGLFGYVLLLDLGLLAVGHRRRWPSLGLLALLGTVLMQGLWVAARMGPARLLLGLAILAVFSVLFVVAGRLTLARSAPGSDARRLWLISQAGAILFPFAFALYFASRVGLGPRLYPIALLLALLCAAAGWVAREQRVHPLGAGAATASVAVVAVWLFERTMTAALAWEMVAAAVGLSLIFHFFVERDRDSAGVDGPAPAALVAAGGFFVLLLFAAATAALPPAPWIAGWAGLAALLYRHAGFARRGVLQVPAAVGLGAGLSILLLTHHARPMYPAAAALLALLVVASLALHAAALARRRPEVRAFADQAAAALGLALLLGLAPAPFTATLRPLAALGTALILGVMVMAAATRLGRGEWVAAAAGATLVVHVTWTSTRAGLAGRPSEALAALLVEAATVVVFTAWPFLSVGRFSADRYAWYAAALAGPLWFPSLRRLFEWNFGDAFIGALPVALGGLSLLAAGRARRAWPGQDAIGRSALVWFAAVALCFVAVAIPLQLEKEWVTIGWALEGLAVIALWRRLDHPGLKYFGLALLAATTARLVANPALLGYYPRSSIRIVNWLLYTYLVPAAALLSSAALLKPLETGRARDWEGGLYAKGRAAGAIGAGLAAIVVVFVWINLAIADWFATGPVLTLSFGDRPAQRLSVSIAWALYALVLLGFGMARRALGLRWISLAFLLVTIGKVFLYDLGALTDLYRVASLVGLAVSLILVSLLYQRFVFRGSRTEGS